jgi:hypothetical protein
MVRGSGAVVGVAMLVMTGLLVAWAPQAAAGCDKSYPPCICANALDSATCTPGSLVTISNVKFVAFLQKDAESGHASVVFGFAWAVEDPSSVRSVPFAIDLESTEDVHFRDAEVAYTHSNETLASSVEVFQAFTYEGNSSDTEVRFTLVAHQGTPDEERVEGTLGFEQTTAGEHPTEDPTGGLSLIEIAIIAGFFGALLGAIVGAVVVFAAKRD